MTSTMPQRRSAAKSSSDGERTKQINFVEETAPNSNGTPTTSNKGAAPTAALEVESLSLDADDDGEGGGDETVPLAEADGGGGDRHNRRVKKWKDSPFAIGLTEPTWMEERSRERYSRSLPPDDTGCLCMSAQVCPLFGAARLGNMAVLKASQEWVEEVELDEETGQPTVRRYARPRIDVVVGPYWPMLCCVTYPLIFGVSGWTLWSGFIQRPGGTHPLLIFVWTVLTLGLIASLTLTAFRDPGIMHRNRNQQDVTWRWSDQADSYRPRHAWFDADTAVIVEGFDHT